MKVMRLLFLIALLAGVARPVDPPVVIENVQLTQVHDTSAGYGNAPDSYIHTLRVDCTVQNTRGVSQNSVKIACRWLTGDGKLYFEETRDLGILKAREGVPVQFVLKNPADSDGEFRKMKAQVKVISPRFP